MRLRIYIERQKRTLQAIDSQCLPNETLNTVMIEPRIWQILHGGQGMIAATGRIPAHRPMSAYIDSRIISAPSQLRNIAEEVMLLHLIGHCMTVEREIDAWAWARRYTPRRTRPYVDEMAPQALAAHSRYGRPKDGPGTPRHVE